MFGLGLRLVNIDKVDSVWFGTSLVNIKIKLAVFALRLRLVNFKIKKVGSVCVGTSLSEL